MAAAGLGGAAGILAARPAIVLGVDGKSLAHSLESKTGSGGDPPRCEPVRPRGWLCSVLISSDGGPTDYELSVNARGCWRARLVNLGELGGPSNASGCVGLTNLVRPFAGY